MFLEIIKFGKLTAVHETDKATLVLIEHKKDKRFWMPNIFYRPSADSMLVPHDFRFKVFSADAVLPNHNTDYTSFIGVELCEEFGLHYDEQ